MQNRLVKLQTPLLPLPAVSPGHVNFLFLQVLPILLSFIIFPYRILIVPPPSPSSPILFRRAAKCLLHTLHIYFYITGREREKYYTYVCKFILREARDFLQITHKPTLFQPIFHSSLSFLFVLSVRFSRSLLPFFSLFVSPFFPARI